MLLNADDMILYIENVFSNVAGYKINIQKLVAFFYTNNEISERECKKQSLLEMHPKRYLEINLTRR